MAKASIAQAAPATRALHSIKGSRVFPSDKVRWDAVMSVYDDMHTVRALLSTMEVRAREFWMDLGQDAEAEPANDIRLGIRVANDLLEKLNDRLDCACYNIKVLEVA